MESKEVIKILLERGHEVKSASSTIDNISAESFIEEFSKPAEPEEPEVEASQPEEPEVEAQEDSDESAEEDDSSTPPLGAIVKSREQVEEGDDRDFHAAQSEQRCCGVVKAHKG